MGLPNMKKNSDEITVESTGGQGTRVRMVFQLS
jgi:anti-sigma regulatory factor (Ser/Thr protein kinase)